MTFDRRRSHRHKFGPRLNPRKSALGSVLLQGVACPATEMFGSRLFLPPGRTRQPAHRASCDTSADRPQHRNEHDNECSPQPHRGLSTYGSPIAAQSTAILGVFETDREAIVAMTPEAMSKLFFISNLAPDLKPNQGTLQMKGPAG